MPVALVRTHVKGRYDGANSTPPSIATAPVAAGNVLLAFVSTRNDSGSASTPTVTSISKPGGESAAWTKLSWVDTHFTGDAARGEIWAIKTTVAWPVGTVVTVTMSTALERGILLQEWSGVEAVLRGAATSHLVSGPGAVSVSQSPLQGDLVVGQYVGRMTINDGLSGDTDTTHGSWGSDQATAGFVSFQNGTMNLVQWKVVTATATQTWNPTGNAGKSAHLITLQSQNVAPNAPTLTSMASGANIDRANVNRASHVFSDPNAGDSQSGFDIRYRLVGSPTWTTVNVPVPNQFYDFPAASLAAGDYERQVRTYDALGFVGPYSPSGFFTAADAPAGPTITDPTNGSTVVANDEIIWSVSNQDAYQVRRVADDAGSPDAGTVYFDTGEVTNADTRTIDLTFEVNNRTEHLQVRVKYDDLWSPWASAAVDVSFTPPPPPVLYIAADPETGSLLFTITNPAPDVDEPAAAFNDVYVNDGQGEERKVTGLPTNTAWRYWTPVSGRDYSTAARVVAVASNGTSSSSS